MVRKAAFILTAGFLAAGCELTRVAVVPSHRFPDPLKVAVLDFDYTPPVSTAQESQSVSSPPNAGKYVADVLSSRLLAAAPFEVLERSKLGRLLQERKLTQAQLVEEGRFEEIGKFLGVDYLILGTVNTYTTWSNSRTMHSGHYVSFAFRCVDVKSSQVVFTVEGKADKGPFGPMDPSGSVQEILDEAVAKLASAVRSQMRN